MMAKLNRRIKRNTTTVGNEIDGTSDAKIDVVSVLKQTAITVGDDTAQYFHISLSLYRT